MLVLFLYASIVPGTVFLQAGVSSVGGTLGIQIYPLCHLHAGLQDPSSYGSLCQKCEEALWLFTLITCTRLTQTTLAGL